MKETPGMKWSKRVLEFQCDKKELMQLRNVELKSRIRDLEVLLSQLSNTMMETMMESSELISQTEILDITIGQLMERLDPGNINIKTGAHKKGRSYCIQNQIQLENSLVFYNQNNRKKVHIK